MFTRAQIEAITASVLRELASRGVAVAPASSLNPSPTVMRSAGSAIGSPVGSALLVELDQRVISEDVLAAANASGKSITIPAGAIITPSGHDFIRRNGVTVTSVLSAGHSTTAGAVILIGTSFTAKSAANTAKWTIVAAGCERDAAKKALKQLPKPVVCCGGEPSVTACLLNRDHKLRVAVVTPNTDVSRLARVMNPQAICLDAASWSSAQLIKVLKTMSPGSTAPTSWKELI